MKKIETIWHHLLYLAWTEKRYKHTQQEIANHFHYSLSTVNHALKVPAGLGAVRKESKFFVLQDARKLLYYWASVRSLPSDLIYTTYSELPRSEREGGVVPSAIYAAYSAAKQILGEPPADYDKVYFYLPPGDVPELKKRFPKNSARPDNLFVLKMHPTLSEYGPFTTPLQTFVDIWNLSDWYARDFTQALEEKLRALLS